MKRFGDLSKGLSRDVGASLVLALVLCACSDSSGSGANRDGGAGGRENGRTTDGGGAGAGGASGGSSPLEDASRSERDATLEGSSPLEDASRPERDAALDGGRKSGNPDGSRDDASHSGDAGGPRVDVEWGGSVVYHDATGKELGRGTGPTRIPLPDGGSVTVATGFDIYTFLAVPAGATLAPATDVPPVPAARQSIRINVPDRPGMTITAQTGCGAATGPGTHVLTMDDSCLENDKAELYIYAFQSGSGSYILVKDIAIGAASSPPLDVALPAWTDLPSGNNVVRVGATHLPAGVTAIAELLPMHGQDWVMSTSSTIFPTTGGMGTASFLNLVPTIGTRWVQAVGYYVMDPVSFDFASQSYLTETVASPFATPAAVDFATLLALPTNLTLATTNTPTISYSLAGNTTTGLDRLEATFAWGTGPYRWHVWAKPGATSLSIPKIANFDVTPPSSFLWVEVRAEERPGVDGWTNVLKGWKELDLKGDPSVWPSGRLARSVWHP